MNISVTAEHIQNGERMTSTKCPIALAVKTATSSHAIVSPNHVTCYRYASCTQHPLPQAAIRFVFRFDGSKSVEPFEFELPGL